MHLLLILLSPVRLNNKNNLAIRVQYSDQVGRKSKISAASAKRPLPPRWRRWWDLELRTTWLCFLSCRLQEQCAQQRLMWKNGIKAKSEQSLRGNSAERQNVRVTVLTAKICLMLFHWSLWNELHVFITKTLHCNTSSAWGQTDSEY